ncbi:hypothetical protein PUNSTDRAFT_109533 [Punctularia strigosozonata HHB-11173 SS5]|uniref:uncharacterized protein n=1 Tax=Punctularia strigosozonata (strain HHB-11173) TaxID=741275 RepID=UPI000441804A|nr:uncharacterized protein PUNSTDRAFT_109533 [Punctularia strigosozonata HHB-11173 SS5]EIN13235.1 hypothetical protein PUNSTDRAFT_109533 [Punctularia strigosozonata HHB-11173 SS5]
MDLTNRPLQSSAFTNKQSKPVQYEIPIAYVNLASVRILPTRAHSDRSVDVNGSGARQCSHCKNDFSPEEMALTFRMCMKCRETGRRKQASAVAKKLAVSKASTQTVASGSGQQGGDGAGHVNARKKVAAGKRKAEGAPLDTVPPKKPKTTGPNFPRQVTEYQTQADCLSVLRQLPSGTNFWGSFAIVSDPRISPENRVDLVHESLCRSGLKLSVLIERKIGDGHATKTFRCPCDANTLHYGLKPILFPNQQQAAASSSSSAPRSCHGIVVIRAEPVADPDGFFKEVGIVGQQIAISIVHV